MKVLTTKGEIEFSDLAVQDIVEVGDNYRKVSVEYRLDGEIVKRSVHIDMLRPVGTCVEQGNIGG